MMLVSWLQCDTNYDAPKQRDPGETILAFIQQENNVREPYLLISQPPRHCSVDPSRLKGRGVVRIPPISIRGLLRESGTLRNHHSGTFRMVQDPR